MNAQKVNTVVTICAAYLPGGSVITMMTAKTIQMNVTVVRSLDATSCILTYMSLM